MDNDEIPFNLQCEQDRLRGTAALFFVICGCKAGALEMCERDAAAFWAHIWDANHKTLRRALCDVISNRYGTVFLPEISELKWDFLSDDERRVICTVTKKMAAWCLREFAKMPPNIYTSYSDNGANQNVNQAG